ncbi:chromosome segregation ATPase [Sporosarcina luteola]|nr:chromosome segregation ATPase [Sporosarcina luteola]
MKKRCITLTISLFLLAGCSFGGGLEKKLSDTMTSLSDSEKTYQETQSELTKLEEKEQVLFTSTMELTKEDSDKVKGNVKELISSVDNRMKLFDKELDSIRSAKDTAGKLKDLIGKADGKEKEKMERLQELLGKRYDLHSSFAEEYKSLATKQKEFYEMLGQENIEIDQLKAKVEEINDSNSKVKVAIESFNQTTKEVNTLKDELFSSLDSKK